MLSLVISVQRLQSNIGPMILWVPHQDRPGRNICHPWKPGSGRGSPGVAEVGSSKIWVRRSSCGGLVVAHVWRKDVAKKKLSTTHRRIVGEFGRCPLDNRFRVVSVDVCQHKQGPRYGFFTSDGERSHGIWNAIASVKIPTWPKCHSTNCIRFCWL